MFAVSLAGLALAGPGCGGEEPFGQQLCSLCLTPGGTCEQGCCAYPVEPEALCQAYTDALCERSRACAPAGTPDGDLWFCELDCSQANACEQIFLSAFPDELRACQAALALAACDPDAPGVFVAAPPACLAWQDRAKAAAEDSRCREAGSGLEGSGTSRVAPVQPPA
jgi:hypothetical protein